MASLLNFLSVGFSFAITALSFAVIAKIIERSITGLAKRNCLSPPKLIFLWYMLTLEMVSLFKGNVPVADYTRMYDFSLLSWTRDIFETGIEALWQISLNFLAYVPLGILAAYFFKGGKKYTLRIFVIVICVSAGNELLQYCFALGVADIDDFIANILGGLWGCSLYNFWNRKNRGENCFIPGIFSGAPIVIVCIFVMAYFVKPYGYIKEDFNFNLVNIESVNFTAIEDELHAQIAIYELAEFDLNDATQRIQDVFSTLNQEVDWPTCVQYDSVVVCHGVNPYYYMWCWDNGFFEFKTMNLGVELGSKLPISKEQMISLFIDMGLEIPESGDYEAEKNIKYETNQLSYDFCKKDDLVYSGNISWELRENKLNELTYEVLELTEVAILHGKDVDALCDQIDSGYFSSENIGEDIKELIGVNCSLKYVADSKGYYRPVYLIECIADGENVELITSAA